MATVKVSQLTEKTVLADADLFPIVDAGQSSSKKVKYTTIKKDIRPYLFCAGSFEQSCEIAPDVTVYKNILSGNLRFTRFDTGTYNLNIGSDNLFTENKTILIIPRTLLNSHGDYVILDYRVDDTSNIGITCKSVATGELVEIDSVNPIPFKIEVYN